MELGGRETHRETRRMGERLKIGENTCAYVYRLLNHSLVVQSLDKYCVSLFLHSPSSLSARLFPMKTFSLRKKSNASFARQTFTKFFSPSGTKH